MTSIQYRIHADLETKTTYAQAAAEGAALRGELGVDAQLIAMSALYLELKAAGRLDEARAIRAQAIIIYEGANDHGL